MVVDIDFRSQLKTPHKTILGVLSQAFSKGDMIRSRNILSFGGLYTTEKQGTKNRATGELDLRPDSLKAGNKQVFPIYSA